MLDRNLRDVVGGAIVMAAGLAFLVASLRLRLGTPTQMGPGFFPLLMSGFVSIIGAAVIVKGLLSGPQPVTIHWRPALAILGAIAGFAVAFWQFGLVPAMVVGIALAALGDRTSRPWQVGLLAAGAAVAAWLIFTVGLGLQMPAFRLPPWLG